MCPRDRQSAADRASTPGLPTIDPEAGPNAARDR